MGCVAKNVSVVIPVFGRDDVLTTVPLLRRWYPELRIVVVDNGNAPERAAKIAALARDCAFHGNAPTGEKVEGVGGGGQRMVGLVARGEDAASTGGECGAAGDRAGIDRRTCAEKKVEEWLAGVDEATFEAALVKLVADKRAAGEYVFEKEGDIAKSIEAATIFFRGYSRRIVELSDGRCVYFAPDPRSRMRNSDNAVCWAEYAFHSVSSGGDRILGKNYTYRHYSPYKVVNTDLIEPTLRMERCVPVLKSKSALDAVKFFGTAHLGGLFDVVVRLDEYGNVNANMTEVTFEASTKRGQKKLPQLVSLTEAIRTVVSHQTATGTCPPNGDSIAFRSDENKGGGEKSEKCEVRSEKLGTAEGEKVEKVERVGGGGEEKVGRESRSTEDGRSCCTRRGRRVPMGECAFHGNAPTEAPRLRAFHGNAPTEEGLVEVVRLEENRGGSGGYNAGMRRVLERHLDCDFVWLLDDDAMPNEGTLPGLFRAYEKLTAAGEKVGSVGATIVNKSTPGVIAESGALYLTSSGGIGISMCLNGEPLAAHPDEIHRVEYVSGCSCLVPRTALETVGLWEDVFIHYDDVEWGLRAEHRFGYRNFATTMATVFHPDVSLAKNGTWIQYYDVFNRLWIDRQYAPKSFRRKYLICLMYEIWARAWNLNGGKFHAYRLIMSDFRAGRRKMRAEVVKSFAEHGVEGDLKLMEPPRWWRWLTSDFWPIWALRKAYRFLRRHGEFARERG